jgi:hypothetical protein
MAHNNEPSEKIAIANKKTLLILNLSASQLEIGSNIAVVKIKAVTLTSNFMGRTPKSLAMEGIAVFKIELSNICINIATATKKGKTLIFNF